MHTLNHLLRPPRRLAGAALLALTLALAGLSTAAPAFAEGSHTRTFVAALPVGSEDGHTPVLLVVRATDHGSHLSLADVALTGDFGEISLVGSEVLLGRTILLGDSPSHLRLSSEALRRVAERTHSDRLLRVLRGELDLRHSAGSPRLLEARLSGEQMSLASRD